jgi:hypothetical protein
MTSTIKGNRLNIRLAIVCCQQSGLGAHTIRSNRNNFKWRRCHLPGWMSELAFESLRFEVFADALSTSDTSSKTNPSWLPLKYLCQIVDINGSTCLLRFIQMPAKMINVPSPGSPRPRYPIWNVAVEMVREALTEYIRKSGEGEFIAMKPEIWK